jgi:NitT/TauT family transport system permease protein
MSGLNAMKTGLNASEPSTLADGQSVSYGRRMKRTAASYSRRGFHAVFIPLLTVVIIGIIWQFILARFINLLYISKPSQVWSSFWALISNGELAHNLPVTLQEAFYGFLLGSLFAVPIAMTLARFKLLLRAATPLVIIFYCIPRMALGPLFIVWLGTGVPMKVWLTASLVFFPMYFMAYDGAKSVDEKLINSVRLMGASRWQILWHVSLPSMLSWLVVGVRQSMPFALTGAIVGELIVSSEGMGYLLAQAGGSYDTSEVLAILFVIGGIGYALNAILNLVENRIFHRVEEKRSGVS